MAKSSLMEIQSMKKVLLLLPVFLVSVAAFGQGNAPSVSDTAGTDVSKQAAFPKTPTFSERYPRYKLRPTDSFDVSFDYTPEYNQTVTVQPDGYVTLRSIGDVYVNGLTVEQAHQKMVEAYNKVLNKPAISILLRDFEKPYFIADGMVNKPGKYDLRGDTTVTQAIAEAGGLNSSYAKHSRVVLFRRVDDNWVQTKVINLKAMEKSGNLTEDVHLRPGDMLFVPKNTASKVQQWMPIYSVNMMGAQTRTF